MLPASLCLPLGDQCYSATSPTRCAVTTQTGCGAERVHSVAFCAGQRFAAVLGAAGLTHTCVEWPERRDRLCPSDSAVRSAERERNLPWYAVSCQCLLCMCGCVCVCVCCCGICTSSITDIRGLSTLKAKKPVQATSCEQAIGHSNTTYLRLCEKTAVQIRYRFNGCNYKQ